jgi:hypothetical protein
LTTDKVCAFSAASAALAFLDFDGSACDWPEAGVDCVVACPDGSWAGLAACGDAAAEVTATANKAADMATDSELLRCKIGMALSLTDFQSGPPACVIHVHRRNRSGVFSIDHSVARSRAVQSSPGPSR